MLLHVLDRGKLTSTFRANEWFLSESRERQAGNVVIIEFWSSMGECVLHQVAVACKLAVTVLTLVHLLHAAVRFDRDVAEAQFTSSPVHLQMLLHVFHARKPPAAISAHVLLLSLLIRIRFLLLVRSHVLPEADQTRRHKVTDRARKSVIARVYD